MNQPGAPPLRVAAATSGFLPLRLVEEHLLALEGLLVLERARTFDRRVVSLEDLQLRLQRHEAALRLREEEAVRLARIGLVSRAATERQAAAWVLARFSGASEETAQQRAEIASLVTPRERERSAGLAALHGEAVAEGALVAESGSADAVLAFWALVAGSEDPGVLDQAVRWLRDDRAAPRVLRAAAYIVGRALTERGDEGDEVGPSGAFELLLGPRLLEVPGLALVVAPFGHHVTHLRLSRALDLGGAPAARLAWIRALGLVGLPAAAPLLARIAGHAEPAETHAALHAFHTMTGLVRGLREDGQPSEDPLDVDALAGWRPESECRHVAGAPVSRRVSGAHGRWPLTLLAEGSLRAGPWGLFP